MVGVRVGAFIEGVGAAGVGAVDGVGALDVGDCVPLADGDGVPDGCDDVGCVVG